MSLLVLDRRDMELRADGAAAVVYERGQRRGSVPIKVVDQLVVQGGTIRLEAGALGLLAEAGGMGVLLSGRHATRVAFIVGPGHNDICARLAQARAVTDPAQIDAWSLRLVHAKLRHQAAFLRAARERRADLRKPLTDALRRLDADVERLGAVRAGEAVNPGAASLRGIEGGAAAAYFKGYAHLFAPALGFDGRNRRPPRDPVNACLSLGYTLGHAIAVQACMRAGIDPMMGLYHRPSHGRASLASDLLEPLRARIDEWVYGLLRDRALRPEHFRRDGDACLLGKSGREVFYGCWSDVAVLARRWLRRQSGLLAAAWREQGRAALQAGHGADDEEES